MAPTEIRAVKSVENGKAEIQTVSLPKLRDGYVLAKVKSVALNPTDWKHVAFLATPGATVGCDFAGIVEEVGPKVTKGWKKGDRIAGFSHGVNALQTEDGCFADYALMKGDVALRIPDNLSFEEAATLGIGITTVGQGLYRSLGLPLPGDGSVDGAWLLIYGGSTATGTLAIQYAKLSGARVVSINSPSNDKLVKSLGADAAFDYHDPECGAKIRKYTDDKLVQAFDCISEGDSGKICAQAISSKGGKISGLLPNVKTGRDDVSFTSTLGYMIKGEPIKFAGNDIPGVPGEFEHGKKVWALAEKLLAEGKIKVHPTDVRQGGLDKIHEGLDDMKNGKVSGKKIVYNIA